MKSKLILILLGLAFFCNPSFNMFDILPDFFGAILVMTGLYGFAFFDGNFDQAHKSAKYLMWISLLKLCFCVWCISGHRDYIMPFTFIFAVLETIFMISMYRSLYMGAEYTLMRSESKRPPKAINEAFTMSFIFTIASKLLDFAPQISDIIAQDAELDLSHKASFKMPMAQLKMYLLAACLAFGVILGIIYLVLTVKAWVSLTTDKDYNSFLKTKYETFLREEREVYVTKKLSLAYLLITVSAVFIPDFYIDAVNVLPSLITVLCLFACTVTVNRLIGKKTNLLLLPLCFAITLINSVYMAKVRLGINYIYSVETFNREAFPLLETEKSIIFALILSLAEAIFMWLMINAALSSFKKCFMAEKRRNVVSRIVLCRILSAFSLVTLAISRVLTTVCGFLATENAVTEYVKNKAFITSGKVYEEMMANPLIVRYEQFVSIQSVFSVISLITALLLIVVLVNMKTASEGNGKD